MPTTEVEYAPGVVKYDLTIREEEVNPDGFKRPGITVNHKFPGPQLECTVNDRCVRVSNLAYSILNVYLCCNTINIFLCRFGLYICLNVMWEARKNCLQRPSLL